MGFFDRNTTENKQFVENRNNAVEDTSGNTIVGSENVNVLDGGAIGGIENTAIQAIRANQGIVSESLDFGVASLLSVGSAFEQAGAQVQRVLETTTGGAPTSANPLTRFDIQNNAIKFSAVAVAVATAAYFWSKK